MQIYRVLNAQRRSVRRPARSRHAKHVHITATRCCTRDLRNIPHKPRPHGTLNFTDTYLFALIYLNVIELKNAFALLFRYIYAVVIFYAVCYI